jgi:hypothetical protein
VPLSRLFSAFHCALILCALSGWNDAEVGWEVRWGLMYVLYSCTAVLARQCKSSYYVYMAVCQNWTNTKCSFGTQDSSLRLWNVIKYAVNISSFISEIFLSNIILSFYTLCDYSSFYFFFLFCFFVFCIPPTPPLVDFHSQSRFSFVLYFFVFTPALF